MSTLTTVRDWIGDCVTHSDTVFQIDTTDITITRATSDAELEKIAAWLADHARQDAVHFAPGDTPLAYLTKQREGLDALPSPTPGAAQPG